MEDTENHKKKRGRRSTNEISGRDALIQSAISVFSRRGYDGASLRMIAKDADVDMALIARLFGSKEQLWHAVVLALAKQQAPYRGQIEQIPHLYEDKPDQAFRAFIEIFANLCIECPEIEAFFTQETVNCSSRIKIIRHEIIDPFMTACLPVIHWLKERNIIKTHHPVIFLKMVFAAISVPLFSFETIQGHEERDLPKVIIEEAIRHFSAP